MTKEKRKNHFGVKTHPVTDNEGLVTGVLITMANKNEIANLEDVLKTGTIDLPKGISLKVDKGYQSKKNAELLKKRNLKNQILRKAYKIKPFIYWERKFNKLIGRTRFMVEGTFGGIKRWLN